MTSTKKVASDFDAIIEAGRKRKENEDLAKSIFSRNRQKDNKKKDDKRPGRPSTPSLASRVGVAKRSSSTSSNSPSPKFQPKPRSSLPGQAARVNRLANEINNETTTNIIPSQPVTQSAPVILSTGGGISIKGASGPFVLHASNFAPGTTGADIESALHPDTFHSNGVSSLVSCKIVNTKPDVVAELVFTEKIVAENIISKYNGQKADGRILRVELVRSGVGSMSKAHSQSLQQPTQMQTQPQRQDRRERDRQPRQARHQPQAHQPSPQPLPPQQPTSVPEPELDFEPEIDMTDDAAMEDLEMDEEAPSAAQLAFKDEREAADRDRRDRDARRDRDDHYDSKRQPNDERRRPENERERDRPRERERDGNRDRDREYERRDERPREDRRGTMPSHYGNGVGGGQGPRGGFGGGYAGGAGGAGTGGPGGGYRGGRYGDGFSGGRGAYRGGYRGFR